MQATAPRRRAKRHLSHRAPWIRAAILGANDAVVSTSSLLVGVAASSAARDTILLAGIAGVVAGAASMAAGEYVSVSSQRDSELADIEVEKDHLATDPAGELAELEAIYVARGLDHKLAAEVAAHLMRHDALHAHLRDELGLDPASLARPVQAALTSGVSFAVFGVLPLFSMAVAPAELRILVTVAASLVCLVALGCLGAWLGGAPAVRSALRVAAGGALAMGLTAAVGLVWR